MACKAQESASLNSRVSAILARMASSDRGARNSAFDDLIGVVTEVQQVGFDPDYSTFLGAFLARHPEHADRVKLGLIHLLEADNVDTTLPPGYSAEENSEYYAQAIGIVASLNDERAIPALVGAMTTGGMATEGLIKYGPKALGPVLSELNGSNSMVRVSAFMTAFKILRGTNDGASHVQMLSLIHTAITDADGPMRETALWAIELLATGDQGQFVPVLQEMAERDPFILTSQTHYRLRDKAKKLLDKLANH